MFEFIKDSWSAQIALIKRHPGAWLAWSTGAGIVVSAVYWKSMGLDAEDFVDMIKDSWNGIQTKFKR